MIITVFTPTFNRAYSLPRLYNSLKEQTRLDFEWLLVDDGSTDNTKEVVASFIRDNAISIRYIKQENGGKHRAINRGVQEANGDWFFIVDSDDYLPDDAIELLWRECSLVSCESIIGGVSGIKSYPNNKRVGGVLSFDHLRCNPIEFRYKYHVKGDMAEMWRTKILKEFPFPSFPNELFMDESVVWFRIAQKYDVNYFNKTIYYCEYLEDGLTRNIRRVYRNSPKGSMLYCLQMINLKQTPLIAKLKAATNYWRYTVGFHGKRSPSLNPIWWMWLFYIPGRLFYLMDKRKE